MLLTTVCGPESFEHLCTVDGTLYNTFRRACIARGLLDDDNEWISVLQMLHCFQLVERCAIFLLLLCYMATSLIPLRYGIDFGTTFAMTSYTVYAL